jgi:uncharacterized membrane protein YfcA
MSIAILAAAAFIAWLISTVAGGTGGLLLTPIVRYLLGAKAVAPVVNLGEFIGEPIRVWMFWKHVRWDIVRWFLPGALVGGVLGGWVFAKTIGEWLTVIVALFLISTVFQFWFRESERSFPMKLAAFLPLGFVIALLSGIVGALGPVLNPFYLNYGVQKEGMIATKSVNSLAMNFVQIGSYTAFGAMTWKLVGYGVTVGIAASLASAVGKKLLHRMSNKTFRRIVIAVMVTTGLAMLWQERTVLGL